MIVLVVVVVVAVMVIVSVRRGTSERPRLIQTPGRALGTLTRDEGVRVGGQVSVLVAIDHLLLGWYVFEIVFEVVRFQRLAERQFFGMSDTWKDKSA